MKKQFILGLFVCVFLMGGAIAASYEENYSVNSQVSSSILQVTALKYEPYPVNPGEYFDLWVKAQWVGTGSTKDATFNLEPQYPFSLDSDDDGVRSFGKLTSEPVVMKFKVRVSDDAVEGINELVLKYNTDGSDNYWATETFDIQVADAQTDFDLVIQESTDSDISLAIANIGKNTANSLIVRIPEQDGYRVSGTNGQMVGNLDSGDYTIVSFSLASTTRSGTATLEVQLDYTDSIGERRSVIKEVQFVSSSPVVGNLTGTRAAGNFTGGNFQRGSYGAAQSSSGVGSWVLAIIIVVGGVGLYYYLKKKGGKENKSESRAGKTPDWVSTERTKRK